MAEEVLLRKGGETVIQISLRRSPAGTTLSVKTIPGVEEFARAMADGEVEDVRQHGRYWTPAQEGQSLIAYSAIQKYEAIRTEEGTYLRLDKLGQPLWEEGGGINLSFLRLKGISEGAGVTFGINGVYTLDALRALREKLALAAKKFYIYYLRPVDLTIQISTQELQH